MQPIPPHMLDAAGLADGSYALDVAGGKVVGLAVSGGGGSSGGSGTTTGVAMYRASTTVVTVSSTTRTATVQFDTVQRADPGYTCSPTTGSVTVPEDGWYVLDVRLQFNAVPADYHAIYFYDTTSNPGVVVRGTTPEVSHGRYTAAQELWASETNVAWIAAGTVVTCAVYDYQGLAYKGDPNPVLTRFSVTKLGGGGPVSPPYSTASRPAAGTLRAGTSIFDTTLGKPLWSNGSVWVDATGTAV